MSHLYFIGSRKCDFHLKHYLNVDESVALSDVVIFDNILDDEVVFKTRHRLSRNFEGIEFTVRKITYLLNQRSVPKFLKLYLLSKLVLTGLNRVQCTGKKHKFFKNVFGIILFSKSYNLFFFCFIFAFIPHRSAKFM